MSLAQRAALFADPAQRQVGLGLGGALDAVDHEIEFRRDQRLAVAAARDAGAVLDQPHLIAAHRAVDFGLRAGPQHDRDVIGAGARDGALETVGHRQECEQHDHHQRDRDHRRSESQRRCAMLLRLMAVTAAT